ncbi:Sec-independent protein translocase protein TatB [Pelagibacteraceae bacterium]|jgi:sec-independent protein translocase protein TatB|nr:Sec-independent protein translocase protein TatB [Pelagibacteraceae bacterium]
MPQIGWSELLIIVVLAILIIGPKDLPVVLKKIASTVKKVKSYVSNIQDDIENAVDIDAEIEKDKKNKNKS